MPEAIRLNCVAQHGVALRRFNAKDRIMVTAAFIDAPELETGWRRPINDLRNARNAAPCVTRVNNLAGLVGDALDPSEGPSTCWFVPR